MQQKDNILKLYGKVQHYAWGGYHFIPSLLNIETEQHQPCAEYWMGDHSSAPSKVKLNGELVDLNALISKDPVLYLGESVYEQFGELPFLLKLLDVRDMLSIQVHPTKEEAIKGYEAEELAGVSLNDPERNYKDKNHKPEVMVALSEFWLLHGFRQESEIQNLLKSIPEFNTLYPAFMDGGYYGLYKEVMELPQARVDEILLPLVKSNLSEANPLKTSPAYWVKKLYENKEINQIDRGIFSIYFFNIVHLLPGEGVFQGAGIPHAYLEGQNVELMANSDNVLRGGLTPKHIDVKELLRHTKFEAVQPNILRGDVIKETEWNYPCPVADFGISAFQLKRGQQYTSVSNSAEIYIVISGRISTGSDQNFSKGESLLVLPSTEYLITAETDCLFYKAFVPATEN